MEASRDADGAGLSELEAPEPRGLTDAQLLHFAEHGWVVQEDAFTAGECASFRAALDRLAARGYCPGPHADTDDEDSPSCGITNVDNMINSGERIFLDWIVHPHILVSAAAPFACSPHGTSSRCCAARAQAAARRAAFLRVLPRDG